MRSHVAGIYPLYYVTSLRISITDLLIEKYHSLISWELAGGKSKPFKRNWAKKNFSQSQCSVICLVLYLLKYELHLRRLFHFDMNSNKFISMLLRPFEF